MKSCCGIVSAKKDGKILLQISFSNKILILSRFCSKILPIILLKGIFIIDNTFVTISAIFTIMRQISLIKI